MGLCDQSGALTSFSGDADRFASLQSHLYAALLYTEVKFLAIVLVQYLIKKEWAY